MNQKGVAHIFLILFLLVGLAIAVYLVQQKTNILPKAYEENPENTFAGSTLESTSEPTPTPASVEQGCSGILAGLCNSTLGQLFGACSGARSECIDGKVDYPFYGMGSHYCCVPNAGPILIESCMRKDCDRFLGKMVCIEKWRNPNGSTFEKVGAATEISCN